MWRALARSSCLAVAPMWLLGESSANAKERAIGANCLSEKRFQAPPSRWRDLTQAFLVGSLGWRWPLADACCVGH